VKSQNLLAQHNIRPIIFNGILMWERKYQQLLYAYQAIWQLCGQDPNSLDAPLTIH
jgi:hypothetical protein